MAAFPFARVHFLSASKESGDFIRGSDLKFVLKISEIQVVILKR